MGSGTLIGLNTAVALSHTPMWFQIAINVALLPYVIIFGYVAWTGTVRPAMARINILR